MNPAVLRRFPLVARARPRCLPLDLRVADLRRRALGAQIARDPAGAAAVFNLAALLASDCGLHDLARRWCHRLARTALAHDSRHGLEPIVNLARLLIRARRGTEAWTLLERLFRAIDTRTDIDIDGLLIPAARLTREPAERARLRAWLWTVLLGTGARALTSAGRWEEAADQLTVYRGVGTRMLDGRQITVIAHALAGRHQQAQALIRHTLPGQPHENAVTACLSLLISGDELVNLENCAAVLTSQDTGPDSGGLAVFRTRLGLTVLDAIDTRHPAAEVVATAVIREAMADGYAARDVLTHPGCLSYGSCQDATQLTAVVSASALAGGAIPGPQFDELREALDISESVLARCSVTGTRAT